MALKFHPDVGTILICRYEPGFKQPEMVKRRPVVVISPRLRRREGLCTVVPLSGTPPDRVEAYHHRLAFERPLPRPWASEGYWVKADMLATVGFHRLDRVRAGREQHGKRKYLTVKIGDEDLEAIRRCVLHALGIIG